MTRASTQAIILGSGSPRRSDLLSQLQITFEVHTPGIAEPHGATVDELALAKFEHLAQHHPGRTILTGDTLVTLDGHQLGKPDDDDHARQMIRACSGNTITVVSAICVGSNGTVASRHVESTLRLRSLSASEIDSYIATGAADDKAGALELQGRAAHFVDYSADSIRAPCENGGCFSNVMGLPMCAVAALLEVSARPALCEWPEQAASVG